jgi:dolichol-phosphate mannosyltransferase
MAACHSGVMSIDTGAIQDPSIAVVVPAHNEASHIGDVLGSMPAFVDRVFVVDDGSTDGTADAVLNVADDRIRLLRHERNGGVGAAMRTGYRAAIEDGFDLAVKMDADGQMRPEELRRLVDPFRRGIADYAKGNRFYFPNATFGMPAHRGFGNAALSFMTKLASGYWHVFDSQCGYTVASVPFLRLLDLDQVADDYFFENDMLIRLNTLNARVVDVPVTTIYGSEVSGVRVGRVALGFPPRLVSGGVRRFWRKHLVTDFGAIAALSVFGIALVLFGGLFGAYHWWESVATGQTATTGTVMIAVLPLIVGIQLLIQAFAMSVAISPGGRETAEYVRHLISVGEFEKPSTDPQRSRVA